MTTYVQAREDLITAFNAPWAAAWPGVPMYFENTTQIDLDTAPPVFVAAAIGEQAECVQVRRLLWVKPVLSTVGAASTSQDAGYDGIPPIPTLALKVNPCVSIGHLSARHYTPVGNSLVETLRGYPPFTIAVRASLAIKDITRGSVPHMALVTLKPNAPAATHHRIKYDNSPVFDPVSNFVCC